MHVREGVAHAAVQWDPELGEPVAWPLSIRWDAADVIDWLGQLYARAGETTEEGWTRAKARGWTVYPIRIKGNLQ